MPAYTVVTPPLTSAFLANLLGALLYNANITYDSAIYTYDGYIPYVTASTGTGVWTVAP